MAVSVQELSKKYGEQWALNKVSIEVGQNEVLGLLGPNGAGKSTLMKCIVGALAPSSGQVWVNEKNVQEFPLETKSVIGYLPENNPLYLDMYVKEYLNFVADLRKIPTTEIDAVIEKTGLAPEKNKRIKALSKGYKQRVGLAQAIIHQPKILILDEPTNGLDPNQIIEIRNLIREVGKDKTIILSTHIMQEVEALCSRVVLLNKGQKLTDTSIEEFRGNFASLEEAFHELTLQSKK
ncbi:MAG: ATP-binding cassette domain-containing protein [Flavobacteriaceae bacterium]|nr:ATP-binding cassette domain-containing protein [Flavobacteriaceae bacterium]